MKKLTKSGLKTLKRKTWEAVSRYVRARDKKCITCKFRPAEHCGHYLHNSERNQQLGGNALWYDLRNLNGQCSYCNTFRGGDLATYALYLEQKYGTGILQELNNLYQKPKKWTVNELLAVQEYALMNIHTLTLLE